MKTKKILIVEDEEITSQVLKEMLQAKGFEVTLATNGIEAMDLIKNNTFPVVVTDIEMPKMDGNELISNLSSMEDSPIIIVLSVHTEVPVIIDIMRKGVYDYIVKPLDSKSMLLKLERAFETAELRRMKKTIQKEKVVKLESQLQWLNWKDEFAKRGENRIDRALFQSLHTNFNQGAGFGLLVSLLDMISTSSKKVDEGYIIKSRLFDMILKSKNLAERVINTFGEINKIISNEFEFKMAGISELYLIMKRTIEDVTKYAVKNKQEILLSEYNSVFDGKYINLETEYFKKVLFEILINAVKFSKSFTDILVIFFIDEANLNISIINTPDANHKGVVGIPLDYENVVFEPFFRLSNIIFDDYPTSDYGLGLTEAQKIIEKHQGYISVANIKDYSDISRDAVIKVNFTIELPLVSKQE